MLEMNLKSTVQRPQDDLAHQIEIFRKDNYSSDRANPGSLDPTLNGAGQPSERV